MRAAALPALVKGSNIKILNLKFGSIFMPFVPLH